MDGAFTGPTGERLRTALMVAAWLLAAFLIVAIVYGVSSLRFIGAGITPGKTITVSGTGKAYAAPDTAEFSFSVISDKPTVAAAQQDAAQKIDALTAYLTGAGVASTDIQTTQYGISPLYAYQSSLCPQGVMCPSSGRRVLTGYEVRQTTDVKVRDIAAAGSLLTGLGSRGATEVSGLTFTVANPAAVETQARDKAIADAKAKAEDLAKALGVSLGQVTSFSESGGPMPAYAFEGAAAASGGTSVPVLSTGQNTITSDVSVTYEIN